MARQEETFKLTQEDWPATRRERVPDAFAARLASELGHHFMCTNMSCLFPRALQWFPGKEQQEKGQRHVNWKNHLMERRSVK